MGRISADRLTFAAALSIAGAFLWQALKLPAWSIFGPGPGLFPVAVTAICCAIAAVLLAFPSLGGETKEDEPEEPMTGTERRVFFSYLAALPLLALSAASLGFFATALLLCLGLAWLVERRSLMGALAFGIAAGLVGLFVFHKLLDSQIPIGVLDDLVLRLERIR